MCNTATGLPPWSQPMAACSSSPSKSARAGRPVSRSPLRDPRHDAEAAFERRAAGSRGCAKCRRASHSRAASRSSNNTAAPPTRAHHSGCIGSAADIGDMTALIGRWRGSLSAACAAVPLCVGVSVCRSGTWPPCRPTQTPRGLLLWRSQQARPSGPGLSSAQGPGFVQHTLPHAWRQAGQFDLVDQVDPERQLAGLESVAQVGTLRPGQFLGF